MHTQTDLLYIIAKSFCARQQASMCDAPVWNYMSFVSQSELRTNSCRLSVNQS
jgi:hypothetical protein